MDTSSCIKSVAVLLKDILQTQQISEPCHLQRFPYNIMLLISCFYLGFYTTAFSLSTPVHEFILLAGNLVFVTKCSCRWIDTGFFLQTRNLFLLLHSIIHLSKDSSLHSIPDPKSFSLQKNILQIESLLFQILEATAVPM